jgi:hypothetical protein
MASAAVAPNAYLHRFLLRLLLIWVKRVEGGELRMELCKLWLNLCELWL